MRRAVPTVLLGLACACSRSATLPFGQETLTVAIRADITGFYPNPPVVSEAFTIDTNRNVFDTLMRFDSQLQLRPSLAERWENPDDYTYIFDLRPGLRFSNGRPLTARDVAASLEAVVRRGWITRDFLHPIESARALSERRLEIRTRFPYFTLLSRLAWGFVLPEDSVGVRPVPTVGSGPYRLERWIPGREILFVRNRDYWGERPAYERVRYLVTPSDQARIQMVLSGAAQVADNIPLSDFDRLERLPGVRAVAKPGLRVLFLAMRPDTPPYSDPRVREAIDLAIDREELIQRVYAGRAGVAVQLVPPAIFGHNPAIVARPSDRVRARRLLDQAGLRPGASLRLHGPIDRYLNDRELVAEVARQLGQVGLAVEVVGHEKREFFAITEAGKAPFHLLGWACASGDAGDVLDNLLHSPQGNLGALNSVGLADRDLDLLIDQANTSLQQAERRQALQAALAHVAARRPVLPLVIQTETLLISRRIQWEPPLDLSLRPAEMRRSSD